MPTTKVTFQIPLSFSFESEDPKLMEILVAIGEALTSAQKDDWVEEAARETDL